MDQQGAQTDRIDLAPPQERPMTEQRNFRRINFDSEADIYIDDIPHRCKLVDLALQGALFTSEEDLPLTVNSQYRLKITLLPTELTLDFTAELIHQRGTFYGFIFVSEDAITMGHLRRLLELNFGDGDEVDREFSHWLKRSSE